MTSDQPVYVYLDEIANRLLKKMSSIYHHSRDATTYVNESNKEANICMMVEHLDKISPAVYGTVAYGYVNKFTIYNYELGPRNPIYKIVLSGKFDSSNEQFNKDVLRGCTMRSRPDAVVDLGLLSSDLIMFFEVS